MEKSYSPKTLVSRDQVPDHLAQSIWDSETDCPEQEVHETWGVRKTCWQKRTSRFTVFSATVQYAPERWPNQVLRCVKFGCPLSVMSMFGGAGCSSRETDTDIRLIARVSCASPACDELAPPLGIRTISTSNPSTVAEYRSGSSTARLTRIERAKLISYMAVNLYK